MKQSQFASTLLSPDQIEMADQFGRLEDLLDTLLKSCEHHPQVDKPRLGRARNLFHQAFDEAHLAVAGKEDQA